MPKFYTKQADKLKYLNNNFRDRNLLKLKKKNKFLTKVIDGLIMYYTLHINIPLHMGQDVVYGALLNSCSYNTLA